MNLSQQCQETGWSCLRLFSSRKAGTVTPSHGLETYFSGQRTASAWLIFSNGCWPHLPFRADMMHVRFLSKVMSIDLFRSQSISSGCRNLAVAGLLERHNRMATPKRTAGNASSRKSHCRHQEVMLCVTHPMHIGVSALAAAQIFFSIPRHPKWRDSG